jgi:co-chaperonin GroES (HSP10)
MIEQFHPAFFRIIVKIYDVDKEKKNTSKGGLITFNTFRPLMNSCGIGEVMAVGSKCDNVVIGDILLFHHSIEDSPDRLLERDDEGEYRIVLQSETHGVVRNKKGKSKIIPMKGYVVAEPKETDHINFEKLVTSVFQIPVSEINPKDESIKHMNLVRGDWIVISPYGAYEISIDRIPFWFVHVDAVIAVNKGNHRLSVKRYVGSDYLAQMSGEKLVTLN